MNNILLWRICIVILLLLWVTSFIYLRKVKDGRKILLLNFIVMLVFEFVLPSIFTKKFQLGILYWMPIVPVIYGLVMLTFSMLIYYIKEENEKSPFGFSLMGTGIAIVLEFWYMYFLVHAR